MRNDVSSDGAAANAAPHDVQVTLYPSADAVGATRRVSFGFPLPPGMLVNTANLQRHRRRRARAPGVRPQPRAWRHMPDQRLLCTGLSATGNPGIRSALIQFDMAFSSTSPVTVTVGVNRARTQSLSTEVPVRDTYRTVNDGTYAAAVNTSGLTIHEPAVLAAIDHRFLDCAGSCR